MNLSQFTLMKEDHNSYHVANPSGEQTQVPKQGLTDKAHALIKKLKKHQSFDEGGEAVSTPLEVEPVNSSSMNQSPLQIQALPQAAAPVEAAQPIQDIELAPGNPSASNSLAAETQAPAAVQQPVVQPPFVDKEAGNPLLAGKAEFDQNLMKEQKQIDKIGRMESGAAYQTGKAYGDAATQLKAAPSIESLTAEFNKKDEELAKKVQDQKIDPQRLWNNKSTGAKIANVFGLILGGFGAGLTHGPNLALQVMDRAIDKDIESQKEDKSTAENLWKMNKEKYKTDVEANLATRGQLLTIAELKAKQAMAQSGSAEAQLRLMPMIQQINQQRAAIHQQQALFAQSKSGGLIDRDPALDVTTLVPKEQQKDVFNEIDRAQNTRRMEGNILESFDQAAKDTRVMSGGNPKNLLPFVESPYVKALHQNIQPTFKDLEGTTRMAAIQETQKNVTPQALDSDETIAIKRQALIDHLNSKKSAPTAKGHGIDLDRYRSTADIPQYQPGAVIDKGGFKYLVNPDGRTATLVKN